MTMTWPWPWPIQVEEIAALCTPLEKLAICVAAMSHDVGHDGLNNAFHCAT